MAGDGGSQATEGECFKRVNEETQESRRRLHIQPESRLGELAST